MDTKILRCIIILVFWIIWGIYPKIKRIMPGCEIVEYNIQIEHIYMAIIITLNYTVMDVIDRIKGMRTSLLRNKFYWLAKEY